MYLIIGNSPQRVPLRDLNDFIYYKQQKVYTDEQYFRSMDLQREIKKGSLTVLKKTEDKNGSFDIPSYSVSGSTSQTIVPDNTKVDALLERIASLEEEIKKRPADKQDSEQLQTVVDKISSLGGSDPAVAALSEAVRRLEAKIEQGSSEALLKRLEEIVARSPGAIATPIEKPKEERRPDEVYVPNITVEDANSHIKLNVRKIETGDSVSDALKKLKELKKS